MACGIWKWKTGYAKIRKAKSDASMKKKKDTVLRFVATSVVSERLAAYGKSWVLDAPEKAYGFWHDAVASESDFEPDKETVVVVVLDSRLKAFAWNRVSLGTVNETSAHPREILRPVLAAAGAGFVLMHNHPSGEPSPSNGDLGVTRRLVEASNLLQLQMVDHVIIGAPSPGRQPYYSFKEAGVIP